jgi:tetratricopeptide (TPR) repeat protein
MNWRWNSVALLCLFGFAGCHFAQLDDPNEILESKYIDAEVMQRNIAQAHATLNERVKKGEITKEQKDKMILDLVQKISGIVDISTVPDDAAWRFADLFRQAGDLDDARKLYERAVEVAPNEDRRVNDSLQLARVMAMQGDVEGAIRIAETTFSAPPNGKAPILMAALYEIFPAGEGKGKDVELAQFLEKAIEQHMLVEVDAKSEAGIAFLQASDVHTSKAWDIVLRVFANEGRTDLFKEAMAQREKLESQAGKV